MSQKLTGYVEKDQVLLFFRKIKIWHVLWFFFDITFFQKFKFWEGTQEILQRAAVAREPRVTNRCIIFIVLYFPGSFFSLNFTVSFGIQVGRGISESFMLRFFKKNQKLALVAYFSNSFIWYQTLLLMKKTKFISNIIIQFS